MTGSDRSLARKNLIPLAGPIVAILAFAEPSGAEVATLAQHDPQWPLDGRTASDLTTPGGGAFVVDELEWRGQFYRGDPAPISGFRLRAYEDGSGQPGNVLVEMQLANVSSQDLGGGTYVEHAQMQQVLSLPPGATLWLDIQAQSPAIPQWGILSIDDPQVDGGASCGVLRSG